MIGLVVLIFLQPVLPELPVPPDLEPPTERPAVAPLEYDTMGISLNLGSTISFEFLARNDEPRLSECAKLALAERDDHYRGTDRYAYLDITGVLGAFQSSASAQFISRSTSCDWVDSRRYSNLNLVALWHRSNLLAASRLEGYASTLSGQNRNVAGLSAKLFWTGSNVRLLSRNLVRLDAHTLGIISDLIMQSQVGFLLITPRVGLAILPDEETFFRPGAGLDLLAVLGNFTFDLEGYYRQTSSFIPDTMLLGPVEASLAQGIPPYTFCDLVQAKLGYRGVDLTLFAEHGSGPFWEFDSLRGLPQLQIQEFSRSGGKFGFSLEQGNFTNTGSLKVFLPGAATSWTPLWELMDSLHFTGSTLGGFFKISASGERESRGISEQPYVLVGAGVYYEKEPFRLLLRVDDLLDRSPFLWPGIRGPGRRVSLSVSLFSTEW